jgi:hypothetical protein
MIARNENCPCGSGKKYKKCCGGPVDAAGKKLTPKGMQRAFLFLIKALCVEKKVDSVTIPCKALEALPKDMGLFIGNDPKQDVFIFKPVKVEKKLIVEPDKRIRLAR